MQSITNCEKIEGKLKEFGIKEENIAIWLAGKHSDNLEEIQNNEVKFLIFKEAVALGWDCPRAHILVRLRETSSIVFDIQTIGRIMRMPELHHYIDSRLNKAYIYTDDDNFEYSASIDSKMQSKIKTTKNESYIKEKYLEQKMTFVIPMEKSVVEYNSYVNGQNLFNRLKEALTPILKDFKYDDIITKNMVEGVVSSEKFYNEDFSIDPTKKIAISDKDISDRYYYYVRKLYSKFNLSNYLYAIAKYENISKVNFRKMFIINKEQLSLIIKKVINEYEQENLKTIMKCNYELPEESYFIKYVENEVENNYLYDKLPDFHYMYDKEIIQEPEYKFSKFLLNNKKIKLWLKNGDVGDNYFSILYKIQNVDNSGLITKEFYPDYICLTEDNKLLIIETKGFRDIDHYTQNKFDAIKPFMDEYKEKFNIFTDVIFSIVRFVGEEPFILMNTSSYISDMADNKHWEKLKDIIGE